MHARKAVEQIGTLKTYRAVNGLCFAIDACVYNYGQTTRHEGCNLNH